MKNKILAAIILLTPIAIVVASSIIFSAGISQLTQTITEFFLKIILILNNSLLKRAMKNSSFQTESGC